LFYVAMTRAQKAVSITYAKMRRKFGGQPNIVLKSRFLNEIPEKLLKANFTHHRMETNALRKSSRMNISINSIVEHKIFGKGKILDIEGDGPNSKITILFYNNEKKKLIYKYANLKIISDE